MNVHLSNCTKTAKDGRVSTLANCFLRGSHVRFMVRPTSKECAPFFRRSRQSRRSGPPPRRVRRRRRRSSGRRGGGTSACPRSRRSASGSRRPRDRASTERQRGALILRAAESATSSLRGYAVSPTATSQRAGVAAFSHCIIHYSQKSCTTYDSCSCSRKVCHASLSRRQCRDGGDVRFTVIQLDAGRRVGIRSRRCHRHRLCPQPRMRVSDRKVRVM